MKKTTYLLYIVGAIQIILGLFHLFAPDFFMRNIGHPDLPADLKYPLAMLASRFIAYGIAFIVIAKNPLKHVLWLWFMVLIQLIDLGGGIYYTLTGVVNIKDSGFPMFNASWITILLLLWMPKQNKL